MSLVYQAVQVKMVLMVYEDHKVQTVLVVNKVHRAQKVSTVRRVFKVLTAKMDLKDPKVPMEHLAS